MSCWLCHVDLLQLPDAAALCCPVGHLYCPPCLERGTVKECPVCGDRPFVGIIVDPRLLCRCRNDCGWFGLSSGMEYHLDCECHLECLQCPVCGATEQRRQIGQHRCGEMKFQHPVWQPRGTEVPAAEETLYQSAPFVKHGQLWTISILASTWDICISWLGSEGGDPFNAWVVTQIMLPGGWNSRSPCSFSRQYRTWSLDAWSIDKSGTKKPDISTVSIQLVPLVNSVR